MIIKKLPIHNSGFYLPNNSVERKKVRLLKKKRAGLTFFSLFYFTKHEDCIFLKKIFAAQLHI